MTYKIHVIHVPVNGSADQANIDKFKTLVEQFVNSLQPSEQRNTVVHVSVTETGSSQVMFTAIIQYFETVVS